MKLNEDGYYILSTGKSINTVCGVLGISETFEDEILYGFDGDINLKCGEKYNYTPVEIKEICDYMINLWSEFKSKHGGI